MATSSCSDHVPWWEHGEMLLHLAMSRILLRRVKRKEDNCSSASKILKI
jgi:hypothetical protein